MMGVLEHPELALFHGHTKSKPTYRAIPLEEQKANQTACAQ